MPTNHWQRDNLPDPHGTRYDCRREDLIKGGMTDDEMANAVFMDPGIANLTGAKARIRWLSREVTRLQTMLDNRPAINAGLPETYIEWSQGVYAAEALRALGVKKS